jgi:hypothetical protein
MPVALADEQTVELELCLQRNQWPMRLLREKLSLALWTQMLERTDNYSSIGLETYCTLWSRKSVRSWVAISEITKNARY